MISWLTTNDYETGVINPLSIVLVMSKLSELSAKGLSYIINNSEARSIFWMTEWILFL